MFLSFAILTHDDAAFLEGLVRELDRLLACVRYDHELVFLDDESKDVTLLETLVQRSNVRVATRALAGDYAAQRNALVDLCRGDYVFHLDTDERPASRLITALPAIVRAAPYDLYRVPRVNRVHGIDAATAARYRSRLDADGRLDWPDYQPRIHRRAPHIRWVSPLHETVEGHASMRDFPAEPGYALVHEKSLEKQLWRWRTDPTFAE